jgi:hypothetical protein
MKRNDRYLRNPAGVDVKRTLPPAAARTSLAVRKADLRRLAHLMGGICNRSFP